MNRLGIIPQVATFVNIICEDRIEEMIADSPQSLNLDIGHKKNRWQETCTETRWKRFGRRCIASLPFAMPLGTIGSDSRLARYATIRSAIFEVRMIGNGSKKPGWPGFKLFDSLYRHLFIAWLMLWSTFNGLTLNRFPYTHSDESWLAGLSLAILRARSLRVTEPFFDLYPRQAHAMKLLFHSLQAGFIALFGNRLAAVRLISMLAGALVLMLIFQYGRTAFGNEKAALWLSVLSGLHIQFIYAAHLARQEILLLGVLVAAATCYESGRRARFLAVPVMIGISALIHPNAFLVGAMVGAVVLKDVLSRQIPFRRLIQFGGILSAFAVAIIALSVAMTPDFLVNYLRFGATHAVDAAPAMRWQNLVSFFVKLAGQISGTYWLPDLRLWFAWAVIAVIAALLILVRSGRCLAPAHRRGLENGLCWLAGFLAATYAIGRNNPTSILFALFPLMTLTGHLLFLMWQSSASRIRSAAWLVAGILLIAALSGSIRSMRPFLEPKDDPYAAYLQEIESNLPPDAIVLGNLSAGFALADKPFYDIRNLEYIGSPADRGATQAGHPDPAAIAAYIRDRGINTVIWYEEYDYILRNPQWRILYEELSDDATGSEVLSSLKTVLEQNGTLTHAFESPVYGTRIVRFMGDYPWQVSLFTLNPASIS